MLRAKQKSNRLDGNPRPVVQATESLFLSGGTDAIAKQRAEDIGVEAFHPRITQVIGLPRSKFVSVLRLRSRLSLLCCHKGVLVQFRPAGT